MRLEFVCDVYAGMTSGSPITRTFKVLLVVSLMALVKTCDKFIYLPPNTLQHAGKQVPVQDLEFKIPSSEEARAVEARAVSCDRSALEKIGANPWVFTQQKEAVNLILGLLQSNVESMTPDSEPFFVESRHTLSTYLHLLLRAPQIAPRRRFHLAGQGFWPFRLSTSVCQ